MENKILIVIPAFNEEENIGNVLQSIEEIKIRERYDLNALVVNDCSTDSTLKILQELKCSYLSLPVNLGIGGAVQAGFKFAQMNNYDFMVQMDGDGQHPSSELPKLLVPAFNKEADIIIGSRFIDRVGFQSSFVRRLGINYFRFLNKILTGVNVNDSTSGFRVFNKRAIALASVYYPDEYPEPEAIVYFSMNNLKIKEVPVIMKERVGGVSSINSLKSIYYVFKVTLGIIFVFLRSKFSK